MTGAEGEASGRILDGRAAAKLVGGLLVGALLVYLLGAVVGWAETVRRLRGADRRWVALACLSSLCCLAAWTKTWQVVIRTLGVTVGYRRLVVTFLAATFANYVTPMGQAGGEPFIAYVLSRNSEATFEESLASVVTADLLRALPFFNVGLVGLGYLIATAGLSGRTGELAAVLVGLAVALPVGVVALWRYRAAVRGGILRAVGPIARRTGRVGLGAVRDRIDRLYAAVERIAGSRRALVVAVGFAYLGWVFFALPLYLSGLALSLPVPALLVAFLVPAAVIAGSTPTPGGLAAIEGTLVVLLGALTALTAPEALAVTTVYRLTSYWFVVAVGGVAALWVLARV